MLFSKLKSVKKTREGFRMFGGKKMISFFMVILVVGMASPSIGAFHAIDPNALLFIRESYSYGGSNSQEIMSGSQRSLGVSSLAATPEDRKDMSILGGTNTIHTHHKKRIGDMTKPKKSSLYNTLQQSFNEKTGGMKLLSFVNGSRMRTGAKTKTSAHHTIGNNKSVFQAHDLRNRFQTVLKGISSNDRFSKLVSSATTHRIGIPNHRKATSLFFKTINESAGHLETSATPTSTTLSLSTLSNFPSISFPPPSFQRKDQKIYNAFVYSIRRKAQLASLVLFAETLEEQVLTKRRKEKDNVVPTTFESFASPPLLEDTSEKIITEESKRFKEWLEEKIALENLNNSASKTNVMVSTPSFSCNPLRNLVEIEVESSLDKTRSYLDFLSINYADKGL